MKKSYRLLQRIEDQEGEEVEIEEEEGDIVRHADARNALQLAALYIEQQNASAAVDVIFIKKQRDNAFKKTMEQN